MYSADAALEEYTEVEKTKPKEYLKGLKYS